MAAHGGGYQPISAKIENINGVSARRRNGRRRQLASSLVSASSVAKGGRHIGGVAACSGWRRNRPAIGGHQRCGENLGGINGWRAAKACSKQLKCESFSYQWRRVAQLSA